jgi:hypothetical protein
MIEKVALTDVRKDHQVLFLFLVPIVAILSSLFMVEAVPAISSRILILFPDDFDPVWARGLLLTGVLFALLIIAKPGLGLYFIVGYTPFQFGLRDLAGGSQIIGLLDDFVLALLLMRLIADLLVARRLRRTPLDVFVLSFATLALVSTIANQVTPVLAVQGLRAAFQPFLFFYVTLHFCRSQRTFKNLLRFLITTSFFQVPLALYQYWRNPYNADAVTGSLGVGFGNTLGYFQLLTVFLLLGLWTYRQKKRYLLAILLLVPSIVLASARSTYFFLLFALPVLYRREIVRGFAKLTTLKIIMISLLVFGIVFLTTQAIPARKGESEQWPSLEELWTAQFDPYGTSGRFAWIKITWQTISRHSSPLIGLGPLMWGSKPASHEYSAILSSILDDLYMNSVSSQVIVVLGEYGIVALVMFYFLFYWLFRFNLKATRSASGTYWKSLHFALEGGLLVFAVGGFVQSTWFNEVTAYYIWLLVAGVYLHAKEILWDS